MTADPTTLNDLQARHAIKLFYDHLPAAVWDGGRKPGTERAATVVGALREEAKGDAAKALAALTANTPDGGLEGEPTAGRRGRAPAVPLEGRRSTQRRQARRQLDPQHDDPARR